MIRPIIALCIVLLSTLVTVFVLQTEYDFLLKVTTKKGLHEFVESHKKRETTPMLSEKKIYSSLPGESKVVLLNTPADVLRIPVDFSHVLIEKHYDIYDKKDLYYLWSYAQEQTPLDSVSIYHIDSNLFYMNTGTIDPASGAGKALCSMKNATSTVAAKDLIKNSTGIDIDEEDIFLGARVATEELWQDMIPQDNDSIWSLSERYLISRFGDHFTQSSQESQIEMIDLIKDNVLEDMNIFTDWHDVTDPDVIYTGQIISRSFFGHGAAECFWLAIADNGKQFIINKDGAVGTQEEFPQFTITFEK